MKETKQQINFKNSSTLGSENASKENAINKQLGRLESHQNCENSWDQDMRKQCAKGRMHTTKRDIMLVNCKNVGKQGNKKAINQAARKHTGKMTRGKLTKMLENSHLGRKAEENG